ncbi:hypothetical protein VPHD508_0146 [Vibrio phage D508]
MQYPIMAMCNNGVMGGGYYIIQAYNNETLKSP